jgi:hypothetical protein
MAGRAEFRPHCTGSKGGQGTGALRPGAAGGESFCNGLHQRVWLGAGMVQDGTTDGGAGSGQQSVRAAISSEPDLQGATWIAFASSAAMSSMA